MGINAPELHTPEGPAARNALAELILGRLVMIRTTKTSSVRATDKKEKFGRYLATVFLADPSGVLDVNGWMVTHGFAVPYMV